MKTSLILPLKSKILEILMLFADPVETLPLESARPAITLVQPEITATQPEISVYDKLYNDLEEICCQFHPVFFTRDNIYYMLIDSQNCIQVDLSAEGFGYAKCEPLYTFKLYNLAIHRELELKGFEIICAGEFHCHYSHVQNTINLLVNPALQRAL